MQTMRRNPRWPLGLGNSSLPRLFPPSAHCFGLRRSALDVSASSRAHSTGAPTRRRRFRKAPESETVSIGVPSLGRPGSIVVIPERYRRRARRRKGGQGKGEKERSAKEDDSLALSSMLDALGEEAASLTPDTIRQQFEEFRTSFATNGKVPMGDWDTLRSNIASSFTYNQLSTYIAEYQRPLLVSENNAGKWIPGTSLFVHANSSGPDGITDRIAPALKLKGKPLLAERILRDCWQLSMAEETGQLDLQLPPSFITLLLNAEFFSFDELASLHSSSIDITHSLGLVRITGKQSDCESIRGVIVETTARVREANTGIHQRVTADVDRLNSTFLEWLGKAHGIALERNALHVPTKILYLAENKRGAEEARRTLDLAIHGTSPTPIPFSTYLPASELASVYHYNPESSVSWFDRQMPWFRWAKSTVLATESDSHTPFFDSHQTRLSDALLKLLRSSPTGDSSYRGDAVFHESVTAAVGRCLFARKTSFDDASLTARQLGKLSLPRTFATEIPQMASFLESLNPTSSEDGAQTYNFRLTPSSRFADVAPELDVEIILKSREDLEHAEEVLEVRKVNIVFGTASVDYLLPENSLDLRFTRTVYRTLWEKTADEPSAYPPMVEDMKRSLRDVFKSSLTSHDPVSLPAFCHLTLSSDNLSSDAQAETSVEYLLPPLNDIREAATRQYDLDGRQLSYRFKESGPFLAHRSTEVSLGMDIPNAALDVVPESQESLDRDFNTFYMAACDMAFKIHKARRVATDDE